MTTDVRAQAADTSIPSAPLQPLLHDSVVALAAPTQVWSSPSGTVGERPIHGLYHSDVRVLDRIVLGIDGSAIEPIATEHRDAASLAFIALARGLDDATADPRVRVEVTRTVTPGGMTERIRIVNGLDEPVAARVTLTLAGDFAQLHEVKAGLGGDRTAVVREVGDGVAVLSRDTARAEIAVSGARLVDGAGDGEVEIVWDAAADPRGAAELVWRVSASDTAAVVRGAAEPPRWRALAPSGDDRLDRWVARATGDLEALRMATVASPDDVFLAAGAPWFFTLFGRDSLWAARLALPLGHELAASTLRVLAGYQGAKSDPETSEQPGRIMHELRAVQNEIPGENLSLPPLYYGTVDATPLWITLLHDAFVAGMPRPEVEALLPTLDRALGWLRDHADSDGDGFLEYIDESGRGLANQGWKDSGDSIRWNDGTIATGPIALCEVQGYAYEAALAAASLLDEFGRAGGDEWRAWAAQMKQRFAAAFWIDDARGGYPAIALDADKRRVDAVTSNIGHLLGTGILTEAQSAAVAAHLVSADMSSGFGLRTMSTDAAGYWPLSYHCGSVWTHDTAIVIAGLAAEGFHAEAAVLGEGLLAAAVAFDYRMPELHAGDGSDTVASPVPYPASCRPQAWSAAAAIAVHAARAAAAAS
jgi:glycogen debranching enzyme